MGIDRLIKFINVRTVSWGFWYSCAAGRWISALIWGSLSFGM